MTRVLVATLVLLTGTALMSQAPPAGTGAIEGRVTDASGLALEKVSVTIAVGEAQHEWQVFTDSDGRFRQGSLPSGGFIVTASRPGYLTVQLGTQRGARVEVGSGQTRSGLVMVLRKAAAISGTLRDEFGDPIVGAVSALGSQSRGPSGTVAPNLVRTDSRGRYRIGGLLPGEYLVVAIVVVPFSAGLLKTGPSGEQQFVDFVPTYYPGQPHSSAASTVRVSEGDEVASMDITVAPVPVAPLIVSIVPPGSVVDVQCELTEPGEHFPTTRTHSGGSESQWTFDHLPAGHYRVSVTATIEVAEGQRKVFRGVAEIQFDGRAEYELSVPLTPVG